MSSNALSTPSSIVSGASSGGGAPGVAATVFSAFPDATAFPIFDATAGDFVQVFAPTADVTISFPASGVIGQMIGIHLATEQVPWNVDVSGPVESQIGPLRRTGDAQLYTWDGGLWRLVAANRVTRFEVTFTDADLVAGDLAVPYYLGQVAPAIAVYDSARTLQQCSLSIGAPYQWANDNFGLTGTLSINPLLLPLVGTWTLNVISG